MEAKPKGGTGGDSASKRSSPQGEMKRGEGGRRGSRDHHPAPATAAPPCGACKFLRRKCVMGCVFAPYFGTEQGAARFAAVHKVFGASNVSKLLQHVPMGRRQDAVVSICYEATARISDPVYGCVSTILALQHQVASLQTELSIVQSQLINSRWVVSNAIQGSQQQQQQHIEVLQPAYSNNSVASNNIASLSSINSGMELAVVGPPRGFEALHIVQPSREEEEESQNLVAFNDGVFNSK